METEAILKLILDKLDSIDNRVGSIEIKIDSIDNRIGDLETRIESLETRIGKLEKRVESIFEQTAMLTEFKIATETALEEINKTIEKKYDLILQDIELIAGEQGKQRIDIARLKAATGIR